MRFRGECGHCGFVAKSVASMQKHMASHEEHPIEDDNSMEVDVGDISDNLGIKSEPDQDEDDLNIGSPELRPDKDGDLSLEGLEKLDRSIAEDCLPDPVALNETFEDKTSPNDAQSMESVCAELQIGKSKRLKSPNKDTFCSTIQIKKEKGDMIQDLPTLRSLLTSEIPPVPDKEGTQQLNSDDFIAFLEKDAGYLSEEMYDSNTSKKDTIRDAAKKTSNPDEIGSQFTSWSVEETGLKQTLSFYCNVAGCKETFSSLDILQGHLRFEHPRIKDTPHGYRCKVNFCGKQYRSFSALLNHLSVDHCKLNEEEDDNEILCILSHCRMKFTSMEEAAKHVREAHNNENLSLIGLKKIKTEFIENVTLNDIPDICKPEPSESESPPYGLNDNQEHDPDSLNIQNTLCRDKKKLMAGNGYRCELEKCVKHFKTKHEFSSHVRTFHAAIGACVYYCAFCTYAATSMERVKEHTRTACMPELCGPKYSKTARGAKSPKRLKFKQEGDNEKGINNMTEFSPKKKASENMLSSRNKQKLSSTKPLPRASSPELDDLSFEMDGIRVAFPHRRVSASGRPIRAGRMKLCPCCIAVPQHRRKRIPKEKKPDENEPPVVVKRFSKQTARKSMSSRSTKSGYYKRNRKVEPQVSASSCDEERLFFDANGMVIKEEPFNGDMYGTHYSENNSGIEYAESNNWYTPECMVKKEPIEKEIPASSTETANCMQDPYNNSSLTYPSTLISDVPNVTNIAPKINESNRVIGTQDSVKKLMVGRVGSLSGIGDPTDTLLTRCATGIKMPDMTATSVAVKTEDSSNSNVPSYVSSAVPMNSLLSTASIEMPPAAAYQSQNIVLPDTYQFNRAVSVTNDPKTLPQNSSVSGQPINISSILSAQNTLPSSSSVPGISSSEGLPSVVGSGVKKDNMTFLRVPVKGMDGKFLLVDITPLLKSGQQIVVKQLPFTAPAGGNVILPTQSLQGTPIKSPLKTPPSTKGRISILPKPLPSPTVKDEHIYSPKKHKMHHTTTTTESKLEKSPKTQFDLNSSADTLSANENEYSSAYSMQEEDYMPCEEHVEENAYFSYDPEGGEMDWDSRLSFHEEDADGDYHFSHICMDTSDSQELDTSMSNEETNGSPSKISPKSDKMGHVRVSPRPRKPLVKSCFCEACVGKKRKRRAKVKQSFYEVADNLQTASAIQSLDDPKLKMKPIVLLPDIFKLLFGNG